MVIDAAVACSAATFIALMDHRQHRGCIERT